MVVEWLQLSGQSIVDKALHNWNKGLMENLESIRANFRQKLMELSMGT